jgi:hypothetical protein
MYKSIKDITQNCLQWHEQTRLWVGGRVDSGVRCWVASSCEQLVLS